MIPGLPSPTIILSGILAFILSTGGAYLAGSHQGRKAATIEYEVVRNQERAAAATIQAQAETRARESENRAAEAARTIEETHAKDLADADATRADFTERLRRATTGPRRCDNVPKPSDNPGVGTITPPGSQSGPGSPDFDAGERLRAAIVALQAYAKACHSFAMESGR